MAKSEEKQMFSQAKSFGLNLLSCPSYHSGNSSSTSVTFRNKTCNICVFPSFFYGDSLLLWWSLWPHFGDYRSVNVLRYFLCYRSDFSTVFKAVWVWKINLLISYFTNLSLKYIDYFLFYFFILVWPASALLENRANTLTRIHPAGKKKSSCLNI